MTVEAARSGELAAEVTKADAAAAARARSMRRVFMAVPSPRCSVRYRRSGSNPVTIRVIVSLAGGIDLGATKIQAIVVDDRHEVLGRARRPTPRKGGPAAVAAELTAAIQEAAAAAEGSAPVAVAAASRPMRVERRWRRAPGARSRRATRPTCSS